MIPWYAWLLIIIVGIGLGIATVPLWFGLFIKIAERFQHLGYVRQARKHNARARELRLQRTEWRGLPLPTGKEGSLRITENDLITNPERISSAQMERAYMDRGLDLKVDMHVARDVLTRDVVISWRPHKGRWPKERY